MPALLATIRQRLRTDLKDDPAARWTDAVLDRHIARAVSEYALIRPLEQRVVLATTNGSRDLDISTLVNLRLIEAIEYPVDLYPRAFVPFTHFADHCELLVADLPSGDNCRAYVHTAHTLSTTVSTIYVEDEEIITTGAAAQALYEYGQYSIDRLNLGGDDADSEYRRQASEYLARYHGMLADLKKRKGLVSSTLFAAVEPAPRRDVVTGA